MKPFSNSPTSAVCPATGHFCICIQKTCSPSYQPSLTMGWKCPGCSRSYAPFVSECPECKKNSLHTYNTTSNRTTFFESIYKENEIRLLRHFFKNKSPENLEKLRIKIKKSSQSLTDFIVKNTEEPV